MSILHFVCPGCNAKLKSNATELPQITKCPKCSRRFQINESNVVHSESESTKQKPVATSKRPLNYPQRISSKANGQSNSVESIERSTDIVSSNRIQALPCQFCSQMIPITSQTCEFCGKTVREAAVTKKPTQIEHPRSNAFFRPHIIALIIPLLAGCTAMFIDKIALVFIVNLLAVGISSVLIAVDLNRLGNVDKDGRKWSSAGVWFLGMCFMWIAVFPFAYERRRRFGESNLVLPALLIALFFCFGPIVKAYFIPPSLPTCGSSDVQTLARQLIRESDPNASVTSIGSFREIEYDRQAQVRKGQCVATMDDEQYLFTFIVKWNDRDDGVFGVMMIRREPIQ